MSSTFSSHEAIFYTRRGGTEMWSAENVVQLRINQMRFRKMSQSYSSRKRKGTRNTRGGTNGGQRTNEKESKYSSSGWTPQLCFFSSWMWNQKLRNREKQYPNGTIKTLKRPRFRTNQIKRKKTNLFSNRVWNIWIHVGQEKALSRRYKDGRVFQSENTSLDRVSLGCRIKFVYPLNLVLSRNVSEQRRGGDGKSTAISYSRL